MSYLLGLHGKIQTSSILEETYRPSNFARILYNHSPLYLKYLGPATPCLLFVNSEAKADSEYFFPLYSIFLSSTTIQSVPV